MSLQGGSTVPGQTPWKEYGKHGIYVDVDTGGAGFRESPLYFTSLGGNGNHWSTSGSNAVYNATSNGFRIDLRWLDGGPLSPEFANKRQWHIKWYALTNYIVHPD